MHSVKHKRGQRLSSIPCVKKFKSTPESSKVKGSPKADDVDEALAKFFFGCNISFNVVKSNHFKNFVNILHSMDPSEEYSPPNRKKLSTVLLDKLHQDLVQQRISVHGSDGVLVIDGWKNSSANTKNVACILHTVHSKSIFLNSWDLTALRETGDQLAIVAKEAIQLAKEKFNITPYAIVSDNASSMISMGKNIDIWHSTCQSHSANLLAKSLVDIKYATKVNKLLRVFKASGVELELKKRGGSRIMLACDTRWCSYRDAFRCLLKNLKFMQELVNEQKVILDQDNNEFFNNPSLSDEIITYTILFDPICALINVCQNSNCSMAEGCEEWLKLQFPIDDEKVNEMLKARLAKVLTPIMLTANFLHPVFRGKRFQQNGLHMAKVLLFLQKSSCLESHLEQSEITLEKIPGIHEYQNNLTIFQKLQQKQITSPQAFWTMVTPFFPQLSSVALKLSNIPAASAQLERLFSSWAFVHSDLRNRLTTDRSIKLVDIYYSLKMSELYDDDYDWLSD